MIIGHFANCGIHVGVCVCPVFPRGLHKLHLDWLRNMAEMKIQKATEDPFPTKIEPLVALLDELGIHLHNYVYTSCMVLPVSDDVCLRCCVRDRREGR